MPAEMSRVFPTISEHGPHQRPRLVPLVSGPLLFVEGRRLPEGMPLPILASLAPPSPVAPSPASALSTNWSLICVLSPPPR
eukprot:363836-Chlamydomonas_euryale.AAC.9